MKQNPSTKALQTRAFTIVELAVIVAVLAMLVCLALPALAKAKTRSPGIGCLSNLRHMMVGWAMYSEENSGTLMLNAPAGYLTPTGQRMGWCLGGEDWHSNPGNINPFSYTNSGALMGPYISSNVRVLTCPADVIPSDNGRRIRSYSMSSQMGVPNSLIFPSSGVYRKESDITCPSPKNAFVFCDESMLTLNDGYLQLALGAPLYSDLPACYHEGGCGFSFADGHAEIHKWQSPYIQIPALYNVHIQNLASSGKDQDWFWIRDHAACRN